MLPREEFELLSTALEHLNSQASAYPQISDFWENISAEEHARRQGKGPVTDISVLQGGFAPEDWEGFDEALESWREEENRR